MKLGLLFSGGKDSTYAGYLAKNHGHEISCLISIHSINPDSFMFHTPSINQTQKQADSMGIPIIIKKTKGIKEVELKDLKKAIKEAKEKYKIQGIITGAVESVYQASRIQKICDKLNIAVFNPLWQKNQLELLEDLIKNKFEIIITGVAAYPLGKDWIGRKLDKKMIKELVTLNKKYGISPSFEGGEFESFVLNSPLFKKPLKIKSHNIIGEKNNWRTEVILR